MPRHMCVVIAIPAGLSFTAALIWADVPQMHVLGVLTAPGDLGALGRVVQVRQGRVIELQIGAAQGA